MTDEFAFDEPSKPAPKLVRSRTDFALWGTRFGILMVGILIGGLLFSRSSSNAKAATTSVTFKTTPAEFKKRFAEIDAKFGLGDEDIEVFTKDGRLTAIEVRGDASDDGCTMAAKKISAIAESLGATERQTNRLLKWTYHATKDLSHMSEQTFLVMDKRPVPTIAQDFDDLKLTIASSGQRWVVAVEPSH